MGCVWLGVGLVVYMAPIHSRKPKLHNPTSIHPQPTQLWIKGKPGQVARPGSVWVLEGEGMPIHGDPNAHGRLFVKFAVEFPPALALTCVGRILVFLVGGVWILVFVYVHGHGCMYKSVMRRSPTPGPQPTNTPTPQTQNKTGRRRWRPSGSSCPRPPPSRARPTRRMRRP